MGGGDPFRRNEPKLRRVNADDGAEHRDRVPRCRIGPFAGWRTGFDDRAVLMIRVDALFRFVILYSALFGAFGLASPFLPAFIASQGLAPDALGLVLGTATAVRLISGTLAGRLADRF